MSVPLCLPNGMTRVTSKASCSAPGAMADSHAGQEGIVGVALFLADVELFVVGLVERRAAAETLDQIGIGQQRAAEGDGICRTAGDGLLRAGEIVAVVEDQIALVDRAQASVVEGQPLVMRRAAGSLQDVEEGEVEAVQFADHVVEGFLRVGIADVVERASPATGADPPARCRWPQLPPQ